MWFSTYRIERQLKALIKADLTLEETYNTLNSKNEIDQLQRTSIELERKKIGVVFDELKLRVPKWFYIDNLNKVYRLEEKPKYAQGTAFTIERKMFPTRYTGTESYVPYEYNIIDKDSKVIKASSIGLTSYLLKAIKQKVYNIKQQEAILCLGSGFNQPIRAYWLYKDLVDTSKSFIVLYNDSLPSPELKAIAILTNKNIGILKE